MAGQRRGNGEGAIYQRDSDSKWCASVDLGLVNGKRTRKVIYGKTRKEVAAKLKALHRDQAAGVNLTPQQQTVTQFLENWLEETVKRQVRVRTYAKYAQDVNHHIIPAVGKLQLTRLTPDHVQKMLNQLADNGLSYNSIRNVRAALRCALNQALRYGYVMRNVATLVDIPGEVTFKAQPLTTVQAQQLLDTVQGDRLEALYRIALGLGPRKGEILGLRWEDVDLVGATICISGSLQRQNGRLERSVTKTEASVRTIALPLRLVTVLKQHRERQEAERKAAAHWTESAMVFTSRIGTPLAPESLTEHFKALLSKAGLPKTVRFHDLRHTCATLMIKQSIHPRVVMEILGHSQISTTMNTYGHVLPEVQREAVNVLDGLFTEGDPGAAATDPPPNAATLSPSETADENLRQQAVDLLCGLEDDREDD
jgi:integrase